MMKVRDAMTKDVLVLTPETTVGDAAAKLATRHVSGAPIVSGGRLSGVISMTDIIGRGGPSAEFETIDRLMTPYVLHVNEDEPISVAIRAMSRELVRRLVVLDRRGDIAGMLTANDVVRVLGADPFACAESPVVEHAEAASAVPRTDQD
jgi:predicted transcriptional regulator